jgi:hypothetical protein
MIYAILACISIVVLITCWFLYKRNIELFLCILIAFYSEIFYLVPKIYGPDDYKILLLPIVIILLFVTLVEGKLALGRYGWWVISYLGISIFGVIVAYFYGQSLSLGIKAAKFIPLIMVYFLLVKREINTQKFVKYFIIMSLVVAVIATIQYFIHDKINLFPGLPKEMLNGNVFESNATYRLTVGHLVIPVAAVIAFARYRQSLNWFYLFAAITLFTELALIQQTRTKIAAVFLSMFVVYVLSNKLTLFRIAAYLIFTGLCLGAWSVLSASDLNNITLVNRTRTDIEKRRGSYQARINAYNYYWQEILKRPLAGYGLLNINWEGNPEKSLQQQQAIHLSDIGITHFIWQAGLIGFIWLIYGLSKFWLDIFRLREYLFVSSYLIIATFTIPTIDMLLRNDSMFMFALFLGLFAGIPVSVKTEAVAEGA